MTSCSDRRQVLSPRSCLVRSPSPCGSSTPAHLLPSIKGCSGLGLSGHFPSMEGLRDQLHHGGSGASERNRRHKRSLDCISGFLIPEESIQPLQVPLCPHFPGTMSCRKKPRESPKSSLFQAESQGNGSQVSATLVPMFSMPVIYCSLTEAALFREQN